MKKFEKEIIKAYVYVLCHWGLHMGVFGLDSIYIYQTKERKNSNFAKIERKKWTWTWTWTKKHHS